MREMNIPATPKDESTLTFERTGIYAPIPVRCNSHVGYIDATKIVSSTIWPAFRIGQTIFSAEETVARLRTYVDTVLRDAELEHASKLEAISIAGSFRAAWMRSISHARYADLLREKPDVDYWSLSAAERALCDEIESPSDK